MTLEVINNEIFQCTRCQLHTTKTHYVPGEGSASARIFFIGEGPGEAEDRQGRPFVGRSGQFLREMIRSIGLREEDYFISNVVKCRPPGNRDPQPEEISACSTYLTRQLQVIRPQVIVTLGRHSMGRFLSGATISQCHGRFFQREDGIYLVPLYHPAVALYSPKQKEVLRNDMKKIILLLAYLDLQKSAKIR